MLDHEDSDSSSSAGAPSESASRRASVTSLGLCSLGIADEQVGDVIDADVERPIASLDEPVGEHDESRTHRERHGPGDRQG